MARAKALPAAPEAIVAAASSIPLDGTSWRTWKFGDTAWQEEAWRHFDICGELRYATNWMANAISRCRLYVAELDDVGKPGEETKDPAIQVLAETMFGGPSLKAEAQRLLGAQLYTAGESFIIAEDVASASKDIWYVCSTSEVRRQGGKIVVDRSNMYGGGKHVLRPGRDLLLRTWTPHPRRYDASDSSVRSVLPVLREIEQLTKKIFAEIDSRLAGAGVLFIPQEVDFPRGPNDPPGAKGLSKVLERAMSQAIQDQSNASALVPLIVAIPGELVDKVKWLTFATPFTAETGEKLVQAIRRLATGLDIPPEVLLGQGDTNHWSAWQIEESTIKIQVEPLLSRICDALTSGYLRAALKLIGKDPDKYVVWYSTAALAVRPNREADARELNAVGIVNDETVRKAGDWSEDTIPSDEERIRKLATDLVKISPALLSSPDIQKALGVQWEITPAESAAAEAQVDLPPEDPFEEPRILPRRLRALPEFPEEGDPAAQEAALLVGSDFIIRRALERAGARMLNRARRASGEFADVPAAEIHTKVAVDAGEVDRLLADGFGPADDLAERIGMEAEVLTDMLSTYTHAIVSRGEPHDYARFSLYMDRALDLVGHGGCNEFCRNPLHPGPCRGWRQRERKADPERARARDEQARTRRQAPREPASPGRTRQPAAGRRRAGQPTAEEREAQEAAERAEAQRAAEEAVRNEAIAETARNRDLLAQAPMPRVTPPGMTKAKLQSLLRDAGQPTYRLRGAEREAAEARQQAAQVELEALARSIWQIDDPASGLHSTVEAVSAGSGSLEVSLTIYDANGRRVGSSTRRLNQRAGGVQAYHAYLQLQPHVQGGGFAARYNARAYQGYAEMGVTRTTVHANIDVGGYTWATQGFDFETADDLSTISRRFEYARASMSPADRAELDALQARSTARHFAAGTHPTPYEYAMLGRARPVKMPSDRYVRSELSTSYTSAARRAAIRAGMADGSIPSVETWAGKTAMLGSSWHGARPITRPVRPGGRAPFTQTGRPRVQRARAQAVTAAAESEELALEEVLTERDEFLFAIGDLYLAYADAVAQEVPANPEDATPTEVGETDYADYHHMISADAPLTDAYIILSDDLLAEWGRAPDDEDDPEAGPPPADPDEVTPIVDEGLVAHAGCGVFCRNPLHPGPCKGWRRQKDRAPADRQDKEPEPRSPRAARRRQPSAPEGVTRRSDASFRDLEPEERANARQEEINKARRFSDVAVRLDEMVANGNSEEALRRLLASDARMEGIPAADVAALRAKVDDPPALRELSQRIAGREGVSFIGRAGEVVPFDPEQHRSIGRRPPAGTPVTVVNAGSNLHMGSEDIQLGRAATQWRGDEASGAMTDAER